MISVCEGALSNTNPEFNLRYCCIFITTFLKYVGNDQDKSK